MAIEMAANMIIFNKDHRLPELDTQPFLLSRRHRSQRGFLKHFAGEIEPAAALSLCIFNARRTLGNARHQL